MIIIEESGAPCDQAKIGTRVVHCNTYPIAAQGHHRATLAQVITSSHNLNQCWLATNVILWHSVQGNVYLDTQDINLPVVFAIYTGPMYLTYVSKTQLQGTYELISNDICIK